MTRRTLLPMCLMLCCVSLLMMWGCETHRSSSYRNSSVVGQWGSAPRFGPSEQAGNARAARVAAPPVEADEVWIIAKAPATDQPVAVGGEDDWPGSGAMLGLLPPPTDTPDAEPTRVPMPLEHTAVHARVDGYISSVEMTQQFGNPFGQKIEAVYVFPLPQDAAVTDFVMTIGDRQIRGIIREREEAERLYFDARAQGYRASLMTQERPNIFTQRVANIEPGKRIDVSVRYFNTLVFEDGWYRFVLPMVVGPRYNPAGFADPVLALPRDADPTIQRPGTEVRYLRPNERSGHDIAVTLDLHPGVQIEDLRSSHAIQTQPIDEGAVRITLEDHDMIPNKDLVVSYRVAGDRIKSNLLTSRGTDGKDGYFTMVLYPPAELGSLERRPMEMVFVIDCSGSMRGTPLTQAKDAIYAGLDRLTPEDSFQIIRFSDSASAFGNQPLPATRAHVRDAKRYVHQLSGEGGTRMIEGIKAALDFPHDPQRLRVVAFLTDGYIGNEAEILAAMHERIGDARVFSFGVGSSTNRYLLERMAKVGRGAATFLGPDDDGEEVMDLYFQRVSRPAMTDLVIDFGAMRVSDVYPARLPDLLVGRPVVVTGRFAGQPGDVAVKGLAGTQPMALTVPFDHQLTTHEALPRVWARRMIADLNDQLATTGDMHGELSGSIRRTALAYGLMSSYTAFIAVDASHQTAGSHGITVHQAVPVPIGVPYETTVVDR